MKKAACLLAAFGMVVCLPAGARKRARVPSPLNANVKYVPYEGTDIAQISYATSRREFRVGYPPYRKERFHVAEYALISAHLRKYERPDMVAEIKLAPRHSSPELTANPVFRKKFSSLRKNYEKLVAKLNNLRVPRKCTKAHAMLVKTLQDEIRLAQAIEKRLFKSQQVRDRELVCRDVEKIFRPLDAAKFDQLCSDFAQKGDLSVFYPAIASAFIEQRLSKATKLVEKAMAEVGVEYAIAEKEPIKGPIK
ncbi:MAG: hypothetical protein D6806_13925 [Deltaproteobacteria bacterium]|nr:MAG: hypothetical protein D6806_13925 [Deltaproteobacteria bacterium]